MVSRGNRKVQLKDVLDSSDIVDGFAVSDKKQPHPAAWDRKLFGFSALWHNCCRREKRTELRDENLIGKRECGLVSEELSESLLSSASRLLNIKQNIDIAEDDNSTTATRQDSQFSTRTHCSKH